MSNVPERALPTLQFQNLEETEALALAVLPRLAADYYAEGADGQTTVKANREVYSQLRLLPRMLRDVSRVSTVTTLLGMSMSYPVMVAPMAMHGLGHPDRELATVRAAKAAGIPFVFSTMATASLDEIAAVGHPAAIFQLYVIRDRDVVSQWVRKAEALGFKALMITVDAPRLGKREASERNRFRLPDGLELKNLLLLPTEDRSTQARAGPEDGSGLESTFAKHVDSSLTWEIVPWLRTITKLPIILKGILSADDAALAVQCGVDAIVVSNHGGRQLDGVPPALEVLPAIVAAVGGAVPVLMDGGVRRGTDVLKALALGAHAVLVGRPVLYGLALGGAAGVSRVLELLRAEVELAMVLAGCASVGDVDRRLLLPVAGSCFDNARALELRAPFGYGGGGSSVGGSNVTCRGSSVGSGGGGSSTGCGSGSSCAGSGDCSGGGECVAAGCRRGASDGRNGGGNGCCGCSAPSHLPARSGSCCCGRSQPGTGAPASRSKL